MVGVFGMIGQKVAQVGPGIIAQTRGVVEGPFGVKSKGKQNPSCCALFAARYWWGLAVFPCFFG